MSWDDFDTVLKFFGVICNGLKLKRSFARSNQKGYSARESRTLLACGAYQENWAGRGGKMDIIFRNEIEMVLHDYEMT